MEGKYQYTEEHNNRKQPHSSETTKVCNIQIIVTISSIIMYNR